MVDACSQSLLSAPPLAGVKVWVAISLGLNRFYTESFCVYFSWLRFREIVSRSSGGNGSILTINLSIITSLENGLCSIIWVVENSLSHTLILNMSRICFDFCVSALRCAKVFADVTDAGVWFEAWVKEKVDAAYGVNDCRSPYFQSTIKKRDIPLPRHLSDKFLT